MVNKVHQRNVSMVDETKFRQIEFFNGLLGFNLNDIQVLEEAVHRWFTKPQVGWKNLHTVVSLLERKEIINELTIGTTRNFHDGVIEFFFSIFIGGSRRSLLFLLIVWLFLDGLCPNPTKLAFILTVIDPR